MVVRWRQMQRITGEKGLGDRKGCFHSSLEVHCNFHTAFLANNNRPEGTRSREQLWKRAWRSRAKRDCERERVGHIHIYIIYNLLHYSSEVLKCANNILNQIYIIYSESKSIQWKCFRFKCIWLDEIKLPPRLHISTAWIKWMSIESFGYDAVWLHYVCTVKIVFTLFSFHRNISHFLSRLNKSWRPAFLFGFSIVLMQQASS